MSAEDIAARTNTTVAAVEKSIAAVEEYQAAQSNEMVDLAVNAVVLDAIPKVAKVFTGGMEAKKLDQAGNKVPDHMIRLKTVETMKNFAELARPRVPGVQVNTQVNNHPGDGSGGPGGSSFEARLRRIREQKGLDNGEGVDYEDAEVVNEEQSVEDELADIGLDIGEEGEEAAAQ